MTLPDDARIAGPKTVADWKAMKGRLNGGNGPEMWQEAFRDFFKARLDRRHFGPIKALEQMNQYGGEGFAIVTLHCSLIEFLASTLEGKAHRYRKKKDPPLGQFEYSNSSGMFASFLEKNEPFKGMFCKVGAARDFYVSVRCGLLHEAPTKGPWKIRVCQSDVPAIDTNAKVVYRDKMQAAFDEFVEWYGQQLSTDIGLQEAFIRKFDSLCAE